MALGTMYIRCLCHACGAVLIRLYVCLQAFTCAVSVNVRRLPVTLLGPPLQPTQVSDVTGPTASHWWMSGVPGLPLVDVWPDGLSLVVVWRTWPLIGGCLARRPLIGGCLAYLTSHWWMSGTPVVYVFVDAGVMLRHGVRFWSLILTLLSFVILYNSCCCH